MLTALAHQQQGDEAQAQAELAAALRLAERTGVILGFIILGEPMAALLRKALPQSDQAELIGRLLTNMGVETQQAEPSLRQTAAGSEQPLLEPLSDRELEVLRLVAAGASNQEIASQLFIALTTVKKHRGNIFGKLGAANRVQALTRVRELALIYCKNGDHPLVG